jgi:hypothetical protein
MPLLDHFHPPVSERRTWERFHGLWAAALVEKLNRNVLAEEYFADMQVHVGSPVEVDIATLEKSRPAGRQGSPSAATLATPVWAPPATNLIVPTVFPDDIEVQVFATVTGATLVGAIELVSPGNKDPRRRAGPSRPNASATWRAASAWSWWTSSPTGWPTSITK